MIRKIIYSDGTSAVCDGSPTMYENVTTVVIMTVVENHEDLRTDRDKLSVMIMREVNESETDEDERDEDGCKWVTTTIPPIMEEFRAEEIVTSDDQHSLFSVIHMGTYPPSSPVIRTPTMSPMSGIMTPSQHKYKKIVKYVIKNV